MWYKGSPNREKFLLVEFDDGLHDQAVSEDRKSLNSAELKGRSLLSV